MADFLKSEDFEYLDPQVIDGPADSIPTSIVVAGIATSIVGPLALLPAVGWWAAKAFNK